MKILGIDVDKENYIIEKEWKNNDKDEIHQTYISGVFHNKANALKELENRKKLIPDSNIHLIQIKVNVEEVA